MNEILLSSSPRNKMGIVRSSRIASVFQKPVEKKLNAQGSFLSVTPPCQAERTGTELLVISFHHREDTLLPASLLFNVLYIQASSVDKAATDVPIYRVRLQIYFQCQCKTTRRCAHVVILWRLVLDGSHVLNRDDNWLMTERQSWRRGKKRELKSLCGW